MVHQELSPTSDTNLVNSLMNLMDCMMDEFSDETKISSMDETDVCSWLRVPNKLVRTIYLGYKWSISVIFS